MSFHSTMTSVGQHHPPFINSETEPTTTKAGMGWFKRSTRILKVRNAADSGWDVVQFAERIAHGAAGASETVDWSLALAHHLTLDADCTVTFSNPVAGATHVLEWTQNGTGGWTITLPSITWPDGTPTWDETASQTNIAALYYDGTRYIGKVVANGIT
jgi:hypothetical protein